VRGDQGVLRTLISKIEGRERNAVLAVLLFGALIYLPRLGSVGLYDPWETHYSEVAREMIARRDFIYPHWSTAYFFSKPVLTLWLIALGLLATGSESGIDGAPLGSLTEWGVRLPFALLAIAALWSVYRIASFITGERRAGLIAAFVMGTSPQIVFLGKQAITDVPMLALTWIGLALFLPAVYAEDEQQLGRTRSLCLAAVFFGLSALAKGLEVAALVGPTLLLTMLAARDGRALLRARPLLSLGVFLLVAAPWYLALAAFTGRDDEGLTFVARFFGHDHFARIASGVHGDRGGAGYYGEQILYGFFPWSAVLPLAILGTAKIEAGRRRAAFLFVLIFGVWSYAFFTASQTKLHHYIAPALPAWAIVVAIHLHSVAKAPGRMLRPGALFFMLAVYAVALRDLLDEPRLLVNLFTYKYDRDYPREVLVRPFLAVIFGGGGLAILIALVRARMSAAFRAAALTAFASAMWLSHVHFNMLSPHWSQAHLFATYFDERRAGEQLLAYQLNWRGETFYSRNEVIEVMNAGAQERMRQLLLKPGRQFVLLERNHFAELRSLLPQDARDRLEIVDDSNAHFYLCMVDRG
jgi:4-amino-4-deoxy-L-arabinose transferase-like glycosyltransferase